jgi:hypothetical protein
VCVSVDKSYILSFSTFCLITTKERNKKEKRKKDRKKGTKEGKYEERERERERVHMRSPAKREKMERRRGGRIRGKGRKEDRWLLQIPVK